VSDRITFVTTASPVPMGMQVYEEEVIARAPAELGPATQVSRTVVRSLRSPLDGTVRLPAWVLHGAPTAVRRAVGATLYGRADAVHRMSLAQPPARVPEIVTVHDTVAWHFPDEAKPEPYAAVECRRAAAVITPSQYSAEDVAERLGLENVIAIPNGVDAAFFDAPPLDDAARARLGIRGRYVLHAGGSAQRKNLKALAQAWPLVRAAHPDVTLVLCGPPSYRRTYHFGALEGTLLTGLLPAGLLPGLVAAAEVVVVPSLHEGFGLPALEAMAAGTQVVAARRTALPEVVGDAGILVEPDAAGLTEGLVHALDDDGSEARRALGRARARDYTWDASARRHAEVWRAVLAGRTPRTTATAQAR
jgi:glycosyltransferase involved in cell wall biosynthesis